MRKIHHYLNYTQILQILFETFLSLKKEVLTSQEVGPKRIKDHRHQLLQAIRIGNTMIYGLEKSEYSHNKVVCISLTILVNTNVEVRVFPVSSYKSCWIKVEIIQIEILLLLARAICIHRRSSVW